MSRSLKSFAPPGELVRTFWFPEDAPAGMGFKVRIKYMSPAVFSEVRDRVRIRMIHDGKRLDEMQTDELRNEIINQILLEAVQSCHGVTFAKLRNLIPLNADAVREAGGLDAEIAMDPTVKNNLEHKAAQENILYLLEECEIFSAWATSKCRNIAAFQGTEWEEQVKNSGSGPDTSSAPQSGTSPATAEPATALTKQ